MTAEHVHATTVWARFCQRFDIAKQSVPLFSLDRDGAVRHRLIGREGSQRPVLMRLPATEGLVLTATAKLVDDWTAGAKRFDGLIYCIGWRERDRLVLLYIGKAETLGKGDGNLSANLMNLATERSKFARWGVNYAYHIGDLSACVLPGHALEKMTSKSNLRS